MQWAESDARSEKSLEYPPTNEVSSFAQTLLQHQRRRRQRSLPQMMGFDENQRPRLGYFMSLLAVQLTAPSVMPMLYKISRDSLPALMPDPGGLDQM